MEGTHVDRFIYIIFYRSASLLDYAHVLYHEMFLVFNPPQLTLQQQRYYKVCTGDSDLKSLS